MKLLSPTNSVYNFKNSAIETEKGGIKTITRETKHVVRLSCGHASPLRQGT